MKLAICLKIAMKKRKEREENGKRKKLCRAELNEIIFSVFLVIHYVEFVVLTKLY